MQSPLQLSPVSTTQYFVSGDVTIHEGAAIAPGVLLQADPGSRIVIHAGACLGLGSVIHAHNGAVEVGRGVILGAGVLLVGAVRIGDRACVGSGTTVFNQSINSDAMIPPGSLIMEARSTISTPEPAQSNGFKPNGSQPVESNGSQPVGHSEETDEVDSPIVHSPNLKAEKNGVYGQAYVNGLLGKLFPHQQNLNNADDPWES